MRFSTLTLAATFSFAYATPFPQDGDAGVAGLVPGVNISNAGVAGAVKNSYIVVFKNSASDSDVEKHEKGVARKLGKGPKDTFKLNGWRGYHLETDRDGLSKVANDPLVDFVEIDAIASVTPVIINTTDARIVSDDAGVASLRTRSGVPWGLGRVSRRARGSSKYYYDSTGCSHTRIYIIDTGIRESHAEFSGRAWAGKNFVSGTPNSDQHGHGTHCAATAAGKNVGVCPYAVVVGVKVLDASGRGPWSRIISGLQWAANDAINKGYRNRAVISMSIEGSKSAAVNSAVQAVLNRGITVVVAAGNANKNAANTSPASAPNAITVGATNSADKRASFSNFGGSLDVFAPGVSVYSAWKSSNTAYAWMDGTSQATPHVAGIAAYLIRKEGLVGPTKVRNRIVALSTKNKVVGPKGSPNRIAYNGSGR